MRANRDSDFGIVAGSIGADDVVSSVASRRPSLARWAVLSCAARQHRFTSS
jgi:hypothetical protein